MQFAFSCRVSLAFVFIHRGYIKRVSRMSDVERHREEGPLVVSQSQPACTREGSGEQACAVGLLEPDVREEKVFSHRHASGTVDMESDEACWVRWILERRQSWGLNPTTKVPSVWSSGCSSLSFSKRFDGPPRHGPRSIHVVLHVHAPMGPLSFGEVPKGRLCFVFGWNVCGIAAVDVHGSELGGVDVSASPRALCVVGV